MSLPTAQNHHKSTVDSLLEAQDWSISPLGHPSTWPAELHTIVKLMLNSRFPMFVAWGPELGLLYNEAYSEFLDAKHPAALGSRFEDVWKEIWPDISPLVDRALAGEATFVEDLPLAIHRHGRRERAWFTFSYSPVQDGENKVAGMYCAVTETTGRVLAERRQAFHLQMADTLRTLSAPLEITAAASALIGQYYGVGRVGYAEIDAAEQNVSVDCDWTNGTIASLAGESRPLDSFGPAIIEELRRGNTLQLDDIAADLRSAPYAAGYASIGARSMIIVPLLEARRLTAILYLHESSPRHWTVEEVAMAEDVARRTWDAVKRARAEEALRDETRILELLNQTGEIVASTLDLETLLQSITDTATQLSGAKFGAFFYNVTDDKGDVLQLYTLSGAPREAFERLGHPRATAVFGPTFNGEAPIRSDDITKDARYGRFGPYHGMPPGHLPVRSYLAVSVISRTGATIGGLFFGHPATGVFTERTERIITGVAAQAAVAIDNAQLYELAQKAASEREMLLARERAAREEAERLTRMKDEFLAMLAHELRNPLAPISSASQLLTLRSGADPWIAKTGSIISRQVAHMTHLVDDLLDVSRVTRGLVTLAKERISVNDVISAAVDQVQPLIEEKRHQLTMRVPAEPVYVEGDYIRLVQVVANLLNNAAKYTPGAGNIILKLVVTEDQLALSVADNGSGIAPDLLPDVFDLFTQGKRTLARSQGGLGLGLTLVKKLVELHGGKVVAYSAGIGQGSEFVIHLPMLESGEHKTEALNRGSLPTNPALTNQRGTVLRVMVIDDNRDAADSLAGVLKAKGHAVSIAYTAQSALELAEKEAPEVFLVDIGLPDMDGFELAVRLRVLPQATQSLLIAVTGYGQAQDRKRAMLAGFAHHLVKPVDMVLLDKVLTEAMFQNNISVGVLR